MRQYLFEFWSKHKAALMAAGAIVLLYLLMFAGGISCPIKFLSGISCPGCGMTRACINALRLDFAAAFSYHPLWVALPFVAFFLILLKIKNKRKAFSAVLYASAIVMLAVYLFRLLFTDSDAVVCSPENGFIYRCVQKLTSFFSPK